MHRILTISLGFLALAAPVAMAQPATVDGFTVTAMAPPTVPAIPVGTFVSKGSTASLNAFVLYLTGSESNVGASPYIGGLATKGPYLSVQKRGRISFLFAKPVSTLYLNWGTIGSEDVAIFYSGGTEVGRLLGSDLGAAFAQNESFYLSIVSPVPFSRIELMEGESCCFEFSNLSAR